ncbi:membrane associated protein-like protein [Novymonas esmeraldas]|uniref:Membrane associated protein-like protein n=1 Tax=Novymonas esmeraldas TaxID=1808958 RepID=A0AAW0EZ52_9TRYP
MWRRSSNVPPSGSVAPASDDAAAGKSADTHSSGNGNGSGGDGARAWPLRAISLFASPHRLDTTGAAAAPAGAMPHPAARADAAGDDGASTELSSVTATSLSDMTHVRRRRGLLAGATQLRGVRLDPADDEDEGEWDVHRTTAAAAPTTALAALSSRSDAAVLSATSPAPHQQAPPPTAPPPITPPPTTPPHAEAALYTPAAADFHSGLRGIRSALDTVGGTTAAKAPPKKKRNGLGAVAVTALSTTTTTTSATTESPALASSMPATVAERQRLAAEAAERQRVAGEAAERERLAAEAAERDRLAAEEAERERLAAEEAERERLAAEAAERERLAAEAAERERLAAEEAERERLAAEEAERDRLAAEAAERDRLAAEEAERERLAAEEAERERLAAEEAERERLAAEAAERERLAAEEAERERLAAEEAERDRLAAEAAERDRLAAEEAERERLAAEEAERERLAAEEAERERLAAEAAERERLAAEEAERERLAAEEAERDRLAAEAAERDRLAAEEAERERLAAEAAERERLAAEEAERERLAAEEAERERLAAEAAERERLAAEEAERERLAAEAAERERLAAEEAERERLAAEAAERERLAAEEAERRRLDAAQWALSLLWAACEDGEPLPAELYSTADVALVAACERVTQPLRDARRLLMDPALRAPAGRGDAPAETNVTALQAYGAVVQLLNGITRGATAATWRRSSASDAVLDAARTGAVHRLALQTWAKVSAALSALWSEAWTTAAVPQAGGVQQVCAPRGATEAESPLPPAVRQTVRALTSLLDQRRSSMRDELIGVDEVHAVVAAALEGAPPLSTAMDNSATPAAAVADGGGAVTRAPLWSGLPPWAVDAVAALAQVMVRRDAVITQRVADAVAAQEWHRGGSGAELHAARLALREGSWLTWYVLRVVGLLAWWEAVVS